MKTILAALAVAFTLTTAHASERNAFLPDYVGGGVEVSTTLYDGDFQGLAYAGWDGGYEVGVTCCGSNGHGSTRGKWGERLSHASHLYAAKVFRIGPFLGMIGPHVYDLDFKDGKGRDRSGLGWKAAAGVEHAFGEKWSGRVAYHHFEMDGAWHGSVLWTARRSF